MTRMRKYGESKMTSIMMATVPHVTSGLGLRKFQVDGFLLTRVYLLMMGLDTPETCSGRRNTLRISCASNWFFFTRLYRDARSTKHKIHISSVSYN